MRRALASLLLVIWIAGFCVPALETQSNIPACCRRDGKHHCMRTSPGDGFHAAAACCPYRHLTALISPPAKALGVQAQAVVPVSQWQGPLRPESPDIAQYVASDTHKRGPPFA